jgi:hypothetical protein
MTCRVYDLDSRSVATPVDMRAHYAISAMYQRSGQTEYPVR